MPSEPQRERLPFEPTGGRPKSLSTSPSGSSNSKPSAGGHESKPSLPKLQRPSPGSQSQKNESDPLTAIPKIVSDRMARRMVVFSGIPTVFGCLTFIASYAVVTRHWIELPNTAVVLVSMAFFGLGVLGLSYGVLSASWEESAAGTPIGWVEFKRNVGRMITAWRTGQPIKSD